MSAAIRERAEQIARDRRADEAAVYLMAIDDDTFARLADEELSGKLEADLRDVFGHPKVAERWLGVIKVKLVVLQTQFERRKGREWDEWRVRAGTYRIGLVERKTRAQHAIAFARIQASEASRERRAGRMVARERAVDRLIERHLDEFMELIEQERAADGKQ